MPVAACCENAACGSYAAPADQVWRRALWVALFANGGTFIAETGYSLVAHSSALQADGSTYGRRCKYRREHGLAFMALA